MFNDLGILFGFISTFFILLFVSMYLLRDLYTIVSNKRIKKIINNFLSVVSRYNNLFLIMSFLFGVLHAISFFRFSSFINTGYMVLLMLLLILKVLFISSKNTMSYYNLSILSYLLLANLIIHLFI